ncbi:MAG: hypothetical protein AAF480_18625, partial [Actinomycetota bacterium]
PAPAPAVPEVEPTPTAEVVSPTPADPHNLSAALGQLLGGSRRAAKVPAMAALTALADGEQVEIVLVGRFRGHEAVAILTDRRVLLANSREWDPEIVSVENLSGLEVEGWIERRAATLRLTDGTMAHVIDRINDTSVAETFTTALRAR